MCLFFRRSGLIEEIRAIDVEKIGALLSGLALQDVFVAEVGAQRRRDRHAAVQPLQLFAQRDNHARHSASSSVHGVDKPGHI